MTVKKEKTIEVIREAERTRWTLTDEKVYLDGLGEWTIAGRHYMASLGKKEERAYRAQKLRDYLTATAHRQEPWAEAGRGYAALKLAEMGDKA